MTLLGALKRSSVEDPRYPLTSDLLADWMGGGKTKAGVTVSENRALGLTSYYRAIAIMAGTIAGLPLTVYKNGSKTKVTQRTVLDNPNPTQTPFEFWQTLVGNSVGWGNGYGRKRYNGADQVAQIWPVHPSRVRVESIDGPDGVPDKLFLVSNRGGEERLSSTEVFHLPYLALDGIQGAPPLRLAREALGLAVAAEDYASSFFGRGATLSGILSTDQDLKKEKAEQIKERWRDNHAGTRNAYDIAVLGSGLSFQSVSIPPQDAELLATRQWQVLEIARMFGMPPHMLGETTKGTSWGTGIEQQTIGFVQFTVQPWLTLIEQRVTRELLPGGWSAGSWHTKYDLDSIMRGDSAARAAFYAAMIQWGVFNRNEVRGKENLEPVDGLDEFLTPSNMTLVSVDGKYLPLGGQPQTQGVPNGQTDS